MVPLSRRAVISRQPLQVPIVGICVTFTLFAMGLLMALLLLISPNQVVSVGFKATYFFVALLGLVDTVRRGFQLAQFHRPSICLALLSIQFGHRGCVRRRPAV